MNRRWMTLIGFIQKEIKQTLRDPRMKIFLFVAPVIQLTIFGLALSNETRNVRLAAQYRPTDIVMHDIMTRALASKWFIPAETTGSDPFEWVQSNEADAVLVAPPNELSAEMERGRDPLQLLVNSKNSLRGRAIEMYMKAILQEVTANPQGNNLIPLQFDVRALYNPTFETSIYMVPGVMSMLVCLVTIILTSMSVARERETGTFETLIASPVRSSELLLGKTVPFVILGMIQVPLILAVGVLLFGLPVRGSVFLLMVASFFFVLTTVAIGLLISTIARTQQQAMLGGFLFLFPAILLSGLMFPIENMPFYMRALAQLNPLSHFIYLLRNILLKGGGGTFFLIHVGALAVLAAVCMLYATYRFRKVI